MSEKDLQLEVQGEVLTVSGERQDGAPEGYRVHRQERGARSFTRSFGQLAPGIDGNAISAELSNGTLRVHLPKSADIKPRRIPIKSG